MDQAIGKDNAVELSEPLTNNLSGLDFLNNVAGLFIKKEVELLEAVGTLRLTDCCCV